MPGPCSNPTRSPNASHAVEQERFLAVPHPEVLEYFRRKATDYDRWLRGMQRLQTNVTDG
jgi:hypothetical protein